MGACTLVDVRAGAAMTDGYVKFISSGCKDGFARKKHAHLVLEYSLARVWESGGRCRE